MMLEAGRRMTTSTDPLSAWTGLGVAIGFGAVVGIAMELHRRYLLPLILGPSETAPLGAIAVQLLPLILLIIALYVIIFRRVAKRRRLALMSRLEPNRVVDVDIFTGGITWSSGHFTLDVDWPAVSEIVLNGDRIEMDCETFAVYLPERAFTNRAAFAEAAKDLRRLWRDAVKREHDDKMIAAGLD